MGATSRLAALLLDLVPYAVPAACPTFTVGTPRGVTEIFDGDTLALADGTRVRLAGLNAPELAHDRRPQEPWAQAARQRLEQRAALWWPYRSRIGGRHCAPTEIRSQLPVEAAVASGVARTPNPVHYPLR